MPGKRSFHDFLHESIERVLDWQLRSDAEIDSLAADLGIISPWRASSALEAESSTGLNYPTYTISPILNLSSGTIRCSPSA
jgi:hypothetical protein